MTGAFVRDEATLWRATAAGVVLLAPGDEEPCALSDTGADLWEMLAAPVTVDRAAVALAARYGTDPAQVEADVRPFLADLEQRGVVRRVLPEPPPGHLMDAS